MCHAGSYCQGDTVLHHSRRGGVENSRAQNSEKGRGRLESVGGGSLRRGEEGVSDVRKHRQGFRLLYLGVLKTSVMNLVAPAQNRNEQ